MLSFAVTSTDITSNARVKAYPSLDVLQVANDAIFRKPGYEPRKRPYDVPSKGKADDPTRSLAVSRSRAKAAVRDIALCNCFPCFFTWTLDPKLIDRYDRTEVSKQVQTFLRNASQRKGFRYILVPELHQDGAIHFHGLCALGSVAVAPAISPYTGKQILDNGGRPVFNMLGWKYGHSTCVYIDDNYEAACNYVAKYITKAQEKIFGKWYYSSRDLKKRPDIEIIDGGLDFSEFVSDNPGVPVVPVYRDVCMAIVQQPHQKSAVKGGEACDPWRVDSPVSDFLQAEHHQGQFLQPTGAY